MIEFWKETNKLTRSLWYNEESPCVFCGAEGGPICPACSSQYFHPEPERCRGCGKLIALEKVYCQDCEAGRGPKQLDAVAAWGHYSGGLRDFIHDIKFKAQPRRVLNIAQPFAEWAICRLPPADGVVAVPMHINRLAERGFNQADVLASALHWFLGLPILTGVERIEPTSSQVPLTRQARLHNMKGAFSIREPETFKGKILWLVDDVTTTGATLEAVAEALRQSGAQEIYGLCLAAGLEKMLVHD